MEMKHDSRGNMRYGAKIIAFFLVAGGLLGILSSILMGFHFAQQHQNLRVIWAILSVALFAWSILTGVSLWRAMPRGFKWAKLLFALQVPVFSVAMLRMNFLPSSAFE